MAFPPFPVVRQPVAITRCCQSPYRDWKTDLFDCCADKSICICGICVPCLACKVGAEYGECCCIPFFPGALVAMRTGLREQLRIKVPSVSRRSCAEGLSGSWGCSFIRGDFELRGLGRTKAEKQMARELKSPC
ncbi:cornifelin [Python bivittatus]|uniref:Cornifelin n=1 Tax=Python bivittatus TaxID=176946 RepID=A0A9F5IGA7_PYTBI|nr:cornifelin [Python bivittatus]